MVPAQKLQDELEVFHAYLRQNGLKRTYQKDLILRTFLDSEGHMSVEDLHQLVRRRDRKVGIVTIFRTMKSLTACGIAREIRLDDGLTRYEHCYHHPHHHHIVCTECHRTIEFVSPELEQLQSRIVERYHFQSIHHRFQIYGLCEDCRMNQPAAEKGMCDTEKIFGRDALMVAAAMERRGMEFYLDAAGRNLNPAGSEVLRKAAETEARHLEQLETELATVQRDERGLARAPVCLHFDPRELDRVLPDLESYAVDGRLELDARRAMELALQFEQRAADFFREYAGKFVETMGKQVLLRFAEHEMDHHREIKNRLDALIAAD